MRPRMESDPFEPLRRDVSALGRILGEALIELEGTAFFDLEERIRGMSKERRALPHRRKHAEDLRAAIAELDTSTAERVARAFAHYFQVVNLAEQYHRVRRYRDYARAGESRLGPLSELATALKRVPRAEAEALLARATVELVFTAHPTEAQRRTVLDKHRRIADLLERSERREATDEELDADRNALREEVTTLWQTEEIRQERPRVGDEVKNALFYLEEILYPLIPRVYATVERALEEAYGEKVRVPPILRFGSWVGADMDGNPNVTPEIALDTAFAQAARGAVELDEHFARIGARGRGQCPGNVGRHAGRAHADGLGAQHRLPALEVMQHVTAAQEALEKGLQDVLHFFLLRGAGRKGKNARASINQTCESLRSTARCTVVAIDRSGWAHRGADEGLGPWKASFVTCGWASALRCAQWLIEQQEEAADAARGPERGGPVQRFVLGVLRRGRARRFVRRRANGSLHRLLLVLLLTS